MCAVCACLLLSASACKREEAKTNNGAFAEKERTQAAASTYDIDDILSSGELIVATLSGPDTYFEYRGRGLGLQFFLATDFARHEGLRLRMETAPDTAALFKMLADGDADIIALPMPKNAAERFGAQGVSISKEGGTTVWAVRRTSPRLAKALQEWAATDPMKAATAEVQNIRRARTAVRRHVHAPYLSRQKGIISTYDNDFRTASKKTGMDWRLIAAQAYQESGFDASATSWAGARGLMQVMPSTAQSLGFDADRLYSATYCLDVAATYLVRLQKEFADVGRPSERTAFVLAAYNAGPGHIRDAMALARKNHRDAHVWSNVREYVLLLTRPEYYRDPVVRHGYMAGNETADYVDKILARFRSYGGTVAMSGAAPKPSAATDGTKAAHKPNRFSKEIHIKTAEELSRE